MIVVRNVFKVQFGRSREATAAWKEVIAVAQRLGFGGGGVRLLTDVVGPFYTIVFETTHASLGEYESAARNLMGNADWKASYGKIVAVCEGGYREIFQVVE